MEAGIELYRELLRREPKQERYRIQLARLLVKAGGLHKMSRHNYDRARRLFQELTRMDPDHAVAHYRLGFLYSYKEDWKQSIHHFERALRSRSAETSKQINREQEMKALFYLARAYRQLSLSVFNRARDLYEVEEDPEVAAAVEPFLENAQADLFASGGVKPYVMVTQDQTVSLNSEEIKPYREEEVAEGELQLDLTGEEKYLLMYPRKRNILPPQLAKLLHFLMEEKGPVATDVIWESVFPDAKNKSIVRRTVQRLRETLRRVWLPEDLILTTGDGYQWNWLGPYKIFYRNDEFIHDEIFS